MKDYKTELKKCKYTMPCIELSEETLKKIDEFASKVSAAKMKESRHMLDGQKEFKRFKTGIMGECAIEKLLGCSFVDWTVGESAAYNDADLKAIGLNVGVKTSEMGKFPVIHKKAKRPEFICIRLSDNMVAVCGLATEECLNTYQDDELIHSPELLAKGTKTGFYGFSELINIGSVEELKAVVQGTNEAKTVTEKKTLGQFMSSDKIVNMILDNIGYFGTDILNRKIIEPSFGDGAFLTEIVKRLISEGKKAELSETDIAYILDTCVFGIEIDENMYAKTIGRLQGILLENGIPDISWKNLVHGDTLVEYEKFLGQMDYCVGNPPYVRIHNIEEDNRDAVKSFRFCNGTTDMYIAFYEIGIRLLNSTGKLGYISPNSFLKNSSQGEFRQFLLEDKKLSAVFDFKDSKLFEEADVYTCICILDMDKNRKNTDIVFRKYKMYDLIGKNVYTYEDFTENFSDKPWILSSVADACFLRENKSKPNKLSSLANVQNGVATNKDDVYIVKLFEDEMLSVPYRGKHQDERKTVYFNSDGKVVPVESDFAHRCVKISRFDGNIDNTYILFPYKFRNVPPDFGYEPISEEELKTEFPLGYAYLCSKRKVLEARDMDASLDWFLFGRSQGLNNSCFKKIIFKQFIRNGTKTLTPYLLGYDIIVYSGFFATVKDRGLLSKAERDERLKEIIRIYSSEDFCKYCLLSGKDVSGGYVCVSAKSVKDFGCF